MTRKSRKKKGESNEKRTARGEPISRKKRKVKTEVTRHNPHPCSSDARMGTCLREGKEGSDLGRWGLKKE